MKYILCAILFINTALACGWKSTEFNLPTQSQVDSCSHNDRISEILSSIRPGESYSFIQETSATGSMTPYEALDMTNKPLESEFITSNDSWKSQMTTAISWKNRVYTKSQDDFKLARGKCGSTPRNIGKDRKKIWSDNDSAAMDCVESKYPEVETEKTEESLRQLHIKQGESIDKFCDRVMRLVSGMNMSASLDAASISSLQIKFETIEKHLKSPGCRPWTAKPLIQGISPSGQHETDLKNAVLKEYTLEGL